MPDMPLSPDEESNQDVWLTGARAHQYDLITPHAREVVNGGVIDEGILTIYVNVEEIATIMCSPLDEMALVVGFLFNEGVIETYDNIALVQLNAVKTVADVFLQTCDFKLPRRLTITSGCGGGISFQDLAQVHEALTSDYRIKANSLLERISDLARVGRLYHQVRGVHTAALCDEVGVLLSAEDIGRHNTLDKLAGQALMQGISTQDRILLTSGRISSEMASKARRLGVPIVMSRTAPTGMAVKLAEAWGICLVGYARRGQCRVYTHGWRIVS